MFRFDSDARLGQMENELWRLRQQLEQAEGALRKRLLRGEIERVQNAYRAVPQGRAFEPSERKKS